MIRAIRIRLYPTPDQKKYLAGLFGAVRFCFNKALYLKTHFYKVKGVNLHPIHDLRKLFKNPCSQAELNKIVPFGFSLQRQKMVFFCH